MMMKVTHPSPARESPTSSPHSVSPSAGMISHCFPLFIITIAILAIVIVIIIIIIVMKT